jgi:PsbP
MRCWKLCTVMLAAGFAAVAAQADDYTDSKAGFRVTIPQGWTQTKFDGDDDLVLTSPNTQKTFGFCFVHTILAAATEAISQADIDRRLAGKFPASYWQTLFEEAGLKSVAIQDAGEEMQNGRNTYYAVVTYKDIRRDHKFKTVVHVLPGRSHHLTCNAYLESYPREEAAFETFFDTFVPRDGGLLVMAPEPFATPVSAPANALRPAAGAIAKQITAAMNKAAQRATLSLRHDR